MTLKQKKLQSGNPNMVTKPAHYQGKVECIEAIESSLSQEGYMGHLKATCLKYLWRFEKKAFPLEDLKKCRWYLDRLIKTLEDLDKKA